MTDQAKAKAAVEWLEKRRKTLNEPCYFIATDGFMLALLRPVAAGTHVIVPIAPTEKCFNCGKPASHLLADGDWCCSDCLSLISE